MPKILRTTDTDFRIITANNGQIILDTTNATDDGSGEVIVRGDLVVSGGTTTVESTITTINDSIIVLAAGNDQNGLPGVGLDRPFSAGIEVERGDLPNARWVYDDSIGWDLGGDTGIGSWLGTQGTIGNETVLPIYTNGILSSGVLYSNATVISVTGTSDYEEEVLRYENGVITPDPITGLVVLDDDHIPNAKAVKDLIDYSSQITSIDNISEDTSKVEVIDKNTRILAVTTAGATTTLKTLNPHGFAVNDVVDIKGTQTSPTDLIIAGLTGIHNIVSVPSPTTFEIDLSTVGGDPAKYVSNSAFTDPGPNNESTVQVTVENQVVANFYDNRVNLSGIEIRGTQISITDSNEDLVISANGAGTVKINDTIEIPTTPGDDDGVIDPGAPTDGVKIYSKSPSTGSSGIFFINQNNIRDEVISKNRALLYGMLF